jgi:hypothetical protein
MNYLNIILCLSMSLCVLNCSSEDQVRFSVFPAQIQFSLYESESPFQKIVTITNEGPDELILSEFRGVYPHREDYRLDYSISSIRSEGAFIEGLNIRGFFFPESIVLPTEHSLRLRLTYMVGTEGPLGELRVRTNAEPQELIIPIVNEPLQGQVIIDPPQLDFGRVMVGGSKTLDLSLTNVGFAPIGIHQVFLNASEAFNVSLRGDSVTVNRVENPVLSVLFDPDLDGVPGLSPEKSVTLQVSYTPTNDQFTQGDVVFGLSNEVDDRARISLSANRPAPCLDVNLPNATSSGTTTIDLGSQWLDFTSSSELVIVSCGAEPMRITEIRYEGDQAISIQAHPVPIDLNRQGEIQSTYTVDLRFNPSEPEVYEGTMIIVSNDPSQSERRVPVVGRGSVIDCQELVRSVDPIDTEISSVVTLDAHRLLNLSNFNQQFLTYEWVVVSRPEQSRIQPVERFSNIYQPSDGGEVDNPLTPTAQVFIDVMGDYVFGLVVTYQGEPLFPSMNCPNLSVSQVVHGMINDDIYIELTWTTPRDDHPTDNIGSDLDLYLRHPNAESWNERTYICTYNNPNPDWGPQGEIGNPSISADDSNGLGPEIIVLNDPDVTNITSRSGPYVVGVRYYNYMTNLGPAEAIVRVYLEGVLAGTYTRTLNPENFWEVTGITWTQAEKSVQEIDRRYGYIP